MNDVTQEIVQLFPQGKEITLKGQKVTVKPFGFGKFPKVLQLLKAVKGVGDLPAEASGLSAIPKMDIATFITENSDVVLDLCCLAIGQKKEWFDDLPGDEGVILCQAIVEVNADFFMARLQPKLLEALSGLTGSVGAMLSPGSSPQATA